MIGKECAEDVSGSERGAKMMASCCCSHAEMRLRCFQGQLHGVTLFSDLPVFHQLLMVTYLPLHSVSIAE